MGDHDGQVIEIQVYEDSEGHVKLIRRQYGQVVEIREKAARPRTHGCVVRPMGAEDASRSAARAPTSDRAKRLLRKLAGLLLAVSLQPVVERVLPDHVVWPLLCFAVRVVRLIRLWQRGGTR